MTDRITPRTLKGFRDYLPEAMISREFLMDTARRIYRSYGYSPIDTPALEYSEVLLGKGSDETDKQTYRFTDHGGRDIALRFDLTVPLARFVAQHSAAIGTPFKRYHIGPVWRGESPQRGRYREFMQCDFDTIGTESQMADIETALVIHDLFLALGIERFTVRINNRRLLTGVLERLELAADSVGVLRAIDKLDKIGPAGVTAELTDRVGVSPAQAAELLAVTNLSGSDDEILLRLPPLVAGSEHGDKGIAELTEVMSGIRAAGVGPDRVRLDVGIARGLDYYTGTVYETYLDDLPDIGSCCSGGRYDDLASLYTKERLPGVGASLGVDRLLAALDTLGIAESGTTTASVLVTFFDPGLQHRYLAMAGDLRRAGIDVEVFPEPRKLGAQLKYADRRGHRLAVIMGSQEVESGTVQLKELATGASREVAVDDLVAQCRDLLAD